MNKNKKTSKKKTNPRSRDPGLERLIPHGLALLKEHYESNDPYVDDYPTARHDAKRHRATCSHCKAYAWYERAVTLKPGKQRRS